LEIDDNLFDVKATMGDPYLGGSDFDQRIVEYILDNFKKEHGIDLSKDPESYSRIREEAEKTKISLSSSLSVNINLPFITNKNGLPVHLSMDLTRAKFESLCEDLLKRTETPCRQALKDAQLTAADIDEVLLVGGMTRMPKVCEIVESIFGRQPLKTVNPDEVVAKGAAIQGGILSKTIGGDVLLLDVTPMSLGIETLGGVFTAIINRQVTIPVQKRQIFSTAYDNQTGVTIVVYQGERPIANQNKLLGQFTLEGIAPAPKGTPQIEVCFDMDANGILQVSATDLGTKKAQKIRIESGKMSEEDIQKHMEQVRLYEEQDKKALKLIEAKNSADAAIDSLDKTIREFKDKIEVDLITELNGIKDKLVEAKSSDNVEEIETLTQELNTKIQKVGEAVYKNTEAQGESQTSNENTAETAETTVE
jgi:molecular chaperone DnaK